LVALIHAYAGYRYRNQEFRTKTLGLSQRSARQLATTDTRGKSEIVFDLRTGRRLTSRPVSIQEQGPHSLRCAVYRRGQSGGPCSDDDKVIQIASCCRGQA